MRKAMLLLLILWATSQVTVPGTGSPGIDLKTPLNLDPEFGHVPLYFISNRGQVNDKVKFYAKTNRYTLWVTKAGIIFDIYKRNQESRTMRSGHPPKLLRDVSGLVFLNANRDSEIVPINKTHHKVNYFIGTEQSGWFRGIDTAGAVLYKNIYRNIDLKIYGMDNRVEYDWIVKPGGNPEDIRFKYKNVKSTVIDCSGNLRVETQFGTITHKRPASFQEKQGITGITKEIINAEFNKIGKNTYSFEVNDYNPAYLLVIDPVIDLEFSTYLGGSGREECGMALDAAGFIYLSGETPSSNFPTKNAYKDYKSGYLDLYIAKINPGDSTLVFSSYFGGSSSEYGEFIAVSPEGTAYIAGDTFSGNIPAVNSYTGHKDAFVAVFDADGNFLGARYVGGGDEERVTDIKLDSSQNVFITGWTMSINFPLQNPYQSSIRGASDFFICKINSDLSGFEYSTYLGGRDTDYGQKVLPVDSGGFYVSGRTTGGDFPVKNAWRSSFGGGEYDAVLMRFSPDGSSLDFSTYLGGSGSEGICVMVEADSGDFWVGFSTYSTDLPTLNPYQEENSGGKDGYIARFSGDGSEMLYASYFGGTGDDSISPIKVDSNGYIYFYGVTTSPDLPLKLPFQGMPGGSGDAVLAVMTPGGKDFLFSTYFGGSGTERNIKSLIDDSGNWYLAGMTDSCDLALKNPIQASCQGNFDAFVAKFKYSPPALSCLTIQSAPYDDIPIKITPVDATGNGDGNTEFTRSYSISTDVTLTAPNVFNDLDFSRWSVDGTKYYKRTIKVTMDSDITAKVVYKKKSVSYGLTVESTPETGVPIEVNPADNTGKSNGTTNFERHYNAGTMVKLSAPGTLDHSGLVFYRWTIGDDEYFEPAVEVPMDGECKCVAEYRLPSEIILNRRRFNFGVYNPEIGTGPQTLLIANSGEVPLNWTLTPDAFWINCSTIQGLNSGEVSVSIDSSKLSPGTYTGTITVSAPGAVNSPQAVLVMVTVFEPGKSGPSTLPFGIFETPTEGAVVSGSIPVSGWVLDDVEVMNVRIYREQGSELISIGDAVFVEGARPGVEQDYVDFPKCYRGGWGYMLLTNLLPNGGNGPVTLRAIAVDKEGNQTNLGSRSIVCDNANAVKPFGTIDAPAQGGIVSGSSYRNQGWVLTPPPNKIPEDGHTILVWVDGLGLGNAVYNIYRPDIAALFPGYGNRNGACAYFDFDTTAFENGTHTICWTVMDNANNVEGIGSRYFTIQNTGNSRVASGRGTIPQISVNFNAPVRVIKGFNAGNRLEWKYPDRKGVMEIQIKQMERLRVFLRNRDEAIAGYLLVGDELRRLPIGSTLDKEKGIFYWQPGPGFLGEYTFLFIFEGADGGFHKKIIKASIEP